VTDGGNHYFLKEHKYTTFVTTFLKLERIQYDTVSLEMRTILKKLEKVISYDEKKETNSTGKI